MPVGMPGIAPSHLQHGLPGFGRLPHPTRRRPRLYHRDSTGATTVRHVVFASSEVDGGTPSSQERSSIRQTLADLDALLGVEETAEESKEEESTTRSSVDAEAPIFVSIGNPEVLKSIADAEIQRAKNAGMLSDDAASEERTKVGDKLNRLVEQAKKLSEAKDNAQDSSAGEAAMRREFENLLSVLTGPRGVDSEDIKTMKDKVFGPQTFWVTETVPYMGIEGGIMVRGNFRGNQEIVFAEVCRRVQELFGDKYTVRLTEELELSSDDMMSPPDKRNVFLIVPTETALPKPTAGWQRGVAAVLLALTLASSLQLGLAANVGLLPKETLAWLANPANLNAADAGIIPPGLENFDPLPFFQSAVTVSGVALLPQLAHELGHAIVAGMKGIKTGPSFLIPNGQVGTFGSVTQLKSLVKNRKDLFDFAAAGLVTGGVVSLTLFVAGLIASHNGGGAEAGLVPVPSALFQGSFLLGGVSKLVLGADAMARSNVFVSPLMIGGWCGLVTFALNALPVGNLDGGRTMLAAFGKEVLGFTSLLSYLGLGLGLLGSSLSLPFGLYVLICQRESERNVQNEVSEVDERRQGIAIALALLAVAMLVPGVPESIDTAFLGEPGTFL